MLSKIINDIEQPGIANSQRPERQSVQLCAQDREGRVRPRIAGNKSNLVLDLLCNQVPVEEEDDQGPAAEEEPDPVDQHDGCAVAPEHREALQDLRG